MSDIKGKFNNCDRFIVSVFVQMQLYTRRISDHVSVNMQQEAGTVSQHDHSGLSVSLMNWDRL